MNFLMSRKGTPYSQEDVTANSLTAEASIQGNRSAAMDHDTYLASDDKEWLNYLSQPLRTFRKPGVSMKEEHQLWLSARARNRAAATAAGLSVK